MQVLVSRAQEDQLQQQPFNEKWVNILHALIMKSPPCQLGDVLASCQRLTQSTFPKELIGRACSDYNEKALVVVRLLSPAPEGTIGLISEMGRQGSRSQRTVPYLDPRADLIFHVDQELQECVSVKKKVTTNDLAAEFTNIDYEEAKPFRTALENALDQYVKERYPGKVGEGIAGSAVYSSMGEDIGGDIEIRFFISSRRSRPKGMWAGQWTSQWRIVFTPDQEPPAKIVGLFEFASHYAEDGNVHFSRRISKQAKVTELSTAEGFAKDIVGVVAALEDDFHRTSEECCLGLGRGPIKALRKVFPVAKERFDWRPQRHQFVREIKEARRDDKPGA
eukprot:TRINITY_DN34841_c0_g1_i1.p1 TRINITY_DN34841_c0_g1~~TRINITY_DN34841_c0_g1_i1.p1  ORF type:complete len:335 (-),score=90.57 TRINITY_DN34841_c0_g1_i1:140-1144(-)